MFSSLLLISTISFSHLGPLDFFGGEGGVEKDERSDYVHLNLIAIYFKLFIFNISTKFQTGKTMDRKLNSNIEENLKLHRDSSRSSFKVMNCGKIQMCTKTECHSLKYTNEISETKQCFRRRID